jgi:hypothetical protein
MHIPRFHSVSKDDGHFYAVAYVFGSYVTPSGRSEGDAFHVLDFSPTPNFSRFSFSTVSPESHNFGYKRGSDDIDTAEYALLCAWQEEGVPPYAWLLFPSAAVVESDFNGDAEARSAYEAARRRVALMLYFARGHRRIKTKYPAEPMFRLSEADLPAGPMNSAESEEISKYVMDYARARGTT